MSDLNFNAKPAPRCKNCGKDKGNHKSITMHCPVGLKGRVGYCQFSATQTYDPKK